MICCIGPVTANTAEEHGLRVDVLAPEASAVSVVDALADHARGLVLEAAASGEEWTRPSLRRKSTTRRRAR